MISGFVKRIRSVQRYTQQSTQYALKYTDEKWMTEYLAAEDYGMDLSREMNLFVISGLSSLLISRHTEGFQNTPANGPDCLSDAV